MLSSNILANGQTKKLWSIADALGSVYGLSNNVGGSVSTFNFDVFGERAPADDSQVFNFGFTGREEENNGLGQRLLYARDRYLAPTVGVWIQRDRFLRERGVFEYVDSNPTNFTDPLGLWKWGTALSIDEGFRPKVQDAMEKAISATKRSKCDCPESGERVSKILERATLHFAHPTLVTVNGKPLKDYFKNFSKVQALAFVGDASGNIWITALGLDLPSGAEMAVVLVHEALHLGGWTHDEEYFDRPGLQNLLDFMLAGIRVQRCFQLEKK